jgi:hypothetical protein
LISILPHINYVAEGIDKKPTVQFSGVNLQAVNGSGTESDITGTGNLVVCARRDAGCHPRLGRDARLR